MYIDIIIKLPKQLEMEVPNIISDVSLSYIKKGVENIVGANVGAPVGVSIFNIKKCAQVSFVFPFLL